MLFIGATQIDNRQRPQMAVVHVVITFDDENNTTIAGRMCSNIYIPSTGVPLLGHVTVFIDGDHGSTLAATMYATGTGTSAWPSPVSEQSYESVTNYVQMKVRAENSAQSASRCRSHWTKRSRSATNTTQSNSTPSRSRFRNDRRRR